MQFSWLDIAVVVCRIRRPNLEAPYATTYDRWASGGTPGPRIERT